MKISNIVVLAVTAMLMSACAAQAQDQVTVSGAALEKANGVYTQSGTFKEHPMYVKADCKIIYKGCKSKWMLYVDGRNCYKNALDTPVCPDSAWNVACGAKALGDIRPTVSLKIKDNAAAIREGEKKNE